MLQRPPSKIEIRAEDKQELTQKREHMKNAAKKTSTQLPLSPVKAVEVKLRLADKDAHDKVVSLLQEHQTHLYRQDNHFYDGPNGELSSNKTVLRVRWFNEDEKVVITMKGKMAVVDGVGRASEDESGVDVATAKTFLDDPDNILKQDLPVIQLLKQKVQLQSLKPLGHFCNVRKVIPWQGETLEIDETQYEWGTVYEIECESQEPEAVRQKLDEFLQQHGIDYKSNTSTKFQNFINRTLE